MPILEPVYWDGAEDVYLVIVSSDTADRFWNDTEGQLEALNVAEQTEYAIAATQIGTTPIRQAAVPASLPAGNYSVMAFAQVGGSPVWVDGTDTYIGGSVMQGWSGTLHALLALGTNALTAAALAADAVMEIQSGLASAADLATVQADTDDIQSRLPAALTASGNIKADAVAISGDTAAADNLEAILDGTGGTLTASDGMLLLSTFGVTGTTTLTGAVTATNASNDIRLGATERALIADAVYDEEDGVDGLTLREFIRLDSSILAGKVSGATGGASVESFRNVTDTKDRVVSTVDAFGNRTSIVLDLT